MRFEIVMSYKQCIHAVCAFIKGKKRQRRANEKRESCKEVSCYLTIFSWHKECCTSIVKEKDEHEIEGVKEGLGKKFSLLK